MILTVHGVPEGRDRHPWRSAVVIGLMVAAAGMFYSLALAPWVRGVLVWWIPDDAWVNLAAARSVANGAYAHIYQATPLLVVTPLYPILLAPMAMIGSRWLQVGGFPIPSNHPAMWLLYGPVVMATGILVQHAARHLLTVAGARSRLGRV